MAEVKEKAATNTATASMLQAESATAEANVLKASKRVAQLKEILKTLEGYAAEMGAQSLDVSKKLHELDDASKELLPGTSDVGLRLSNAEQVVKMYKQQADEDLEGKIATSLLGNSSAPRTT